MSDIQWEKVVVDGVEKEIMVTLRPSLQQKKMRPKIPVQEALKKKEHAVKNYVKRPMVLDEVVLDEYGKPDTDLLTVTQMRMIGKFRKHHGVVSRACREAIVSRDTFYRWMQENKIFSHLIDRARNENVDYVENKLWDRIERGDAWAIQMYLKANHPAYSDKLQINIKQMTPSWMEKLKGPKKKQEYVPSVNRVAGLEKYIDRVERDRSGSGTGILPAPLSTAGARVGEPVPGSGLAPAGGEEYAGGK